MATKKKQAPQEESSKSIAAQTEAFLKAGGKINQIDTGVSGQQSVAGPKHIQLGNSKPQGKPIA